MSSNGSNRNVDSFVPWGLFLVLLAKTSSRPCKRDADSCVGLLLEIRLDRSQNPSSYNVRFNAARSCQPVYTKFIGRSTCFVTDRILRDEFSQAF